MDNHSATDEDSGEELCDDVLRDLINDIENLTLLIAKDDNKD